MTIRQKIGNIPVWKVVIVSLFSFGVLMVAIEEVFVSRVFDVMDKMIVAFQNDSRDENLSWAKESREISELNKNQRKSFSELNNKYDQINKNDTHKSFCQSYLKYKRSESYIEAHKNDKKDQIQMIFSESSFINHDKPSSVVDLERAIKSGQFDPKSCKEDVS